MVMSVGKINDLLRKSIRAISDSQKWNASTELAAPYAVAASDAGYEAVQGLSRTSLAVPAASREIALAEAIAGVRGPDEAMGSTSFLDFNLMKNARSHFESAILQLNMKRI